MQLKATDLIGLSILQQDSLRKVVDYLDASITAGVKSFPHVPDTMFYDFDYLQTKSIIDSLRWTWYNSVGKSVPMETVHYAFNPEAAETLSSITSLIGGRRKEVFNPIKLFTAGEQGAWYDPSDLTTMWQDPEGTTPVTAVGQSVAIMLDKCKGTTQDVELMPALTSATLDAGVSLLPTGFRFTAAAQNAKAALAPVTPIDNLLFYDVRFAVSGYTAGAFRIRIFGNGETGYAYPVGVTSNGTYRAVIDVYPTATDTQHIYIEAIGVAPNTFDVTDISIRPIPGNHVWTTDLTARPILQQDANGKYYLAFDGLNDGLRAADLVGATFPFTMLAALQANGNTSSGAFSVFGGAPPYYDIQKTSTANQWRAWVRGTTNYGNTETVGTNATPHTLRATFTATNVNLVMDGINNNLATAQNNPIGTVTDIRIGNGGGGWFGGKFYGGLVYFGDLSPAETILLDQWAGTLIA